MLLGRRKNRSTTAINDEYSLTHTKGIRDYTYLNTLGFGAGGLPPSTFSHLSKNWSIIRSLKLQSTSSIGMSPSGTVMGGSVPAHSGGKGLARHRVKKALKSIEYLILYWCVCLLIRCSQGTVEIERKIKSCFMSDFVTERRCGLLSY